MPMRPTPPDESDPKITVLYSAEEQAEAESLAQYWDATVRGRPTDPRTLDLQLALVVHLLRHYHDVTQGHPDIPEALSPAAPQRPSPMRHTPWRPMMGVTMASVALLFLLFAVSAITSPRSWLLSNASDPDWIPWVSDDWLGPDAVTARAIGVRPALPHGASEWGADGA